MNSNHVVAVRSNNKKKQNAICQQTMRIVVNVIKLSSITLASMSLRRTKPTSHATTAIAPSHLSMGKHEPSTMTKLAMGNTQGVAYSPPLVKLNSGSRLMSLKKPSDMNNSKLSSYVVPEASTVGEKGSSSLYKKIDQEPQRKMSRNVDSEASSFIRRFHEKNRKLLWNNSNSKKSSTTSSNYIILPPPPPPITRK